MPSRSLLTLAVSLCLCAVAVGCAVGLGAVGELPFWLRVVCPIFCVAVACAGFSHLMLQRKIHHLDISGSGQIRLRSVRCDQQEKTDIAQRNIDGMLVVLLADSTLWPHFLLLRLQDEHGQVHALPILFDSLSTESFRAVSVACRWIAAHRFSETN